MDSAGSNKNYLMPFLWMRGENEDILRNEMIKISECGIGAVCLEARPHPDYAGKGWFHDLDIVIEEAKKRGMKVWILDDAHFPTGQANGKMKEHPSLCRRFLYTRFVDATGPIPCANVDVDLLLTRQVTWVDLGREAEEPLLKEARLLSVCVAQMDSGDTIKGDLYDITDLVKDGKLTWNVPAGTWRIYVTSVTTEGPKSNYINYIESSSVRLLIDEVYEKHYERYASEFGKTILGFFSDEPGFYNTDSFGRDNHIGMDMHLPWGREMEECFAQKVGQDWKKKLPLLWNKHTNGNEKLIRYTYMDQVSYLYEKNFSIQIGSWCRDHGVSYIGHVVEDWEGHMRLGAGAGHYFRAMAGQDMAGIDNIGNQIVPGNECVNRHAGPLITEGSFYHYEIAKLGASEAAIDPKKKGRLLCENFGAYGWHLGVRDMRWLVDFLVCQGVNHFVPHAFSMAEYPDSDCPPHFYARGNNPQFPFFADLMRYTNRLCDLFQGGKNVPQVGVLYEADADWAGRAMTGDIPAKELLTHQIDFIYIPSDVFKEQDAYALTVDGGILAVNGRPLQALVFPEAEFIPASAVSFLRSNPEVQAVFIGSRPERICGMGEGGRIPDLKKYPVVLLDDLSSYLKGIGVGDSVEVTISDRNLRMYHYRKDDRDIFFFMNTSLSDTVWTTVCLPDARSYGLYDAWKDVWYSLPVRGRQHSGRNEYPLTLKPYETAVIMTDPEYMFNPKKVLLPYPFCKTIGRRYLEGWRVSINEIGKVESEELEIGTLRPISALRPDFSGTVVYETQFVLGTELGEEGTVEDDMVFFEAEHVFECMEVSVNGISCGSRVIPPYEMEISRALKSGINTLRVAVATTPLRNANTSPGIFGKERTVLDPTGMFGKTQLVFKKKLS